MSVFSCPNSIMDTADNGRTEYGRLRPSILRDLCRAVAVKFADRTDTNSSSIDAHRTVAPIIADMSDCIPLRNLFEIMWMRNKSLYTQTFLYINPSDEMTCT